MEKNPWKSGTMEKMKSNWEVWWEVWSAPIKSSHHTTNKPQHHRHGNVLVTLKNTEILEIWSNSNHTTNTDHGHRNMPITLETRAHNLCNDNRQLIVIAINRNRSASKKKSQLIAINRD